MLKKDEQDFLEEESLREIWRLGYFVTYKRVGSCYINGVGEDLDILMHNRDFNLIAHQLENNGWVKDDGAHYAELPMLSLKKGKVNLLFAQTLQDYFKFSAAADVCKLISDGTLSKPYRVAIHEIILNGASIEDAIARGRDFEVPEDGLGQDVHPVAENELRAIDPQINWQIIHHDERHPQVPFDNAIEWRAN